MAMQLASSNYPMLDLFWTMLIFFLWIMWFFLLFRVLMDIFRSHDMGGWAKAFWIVFVIVLPFLGVLVYVIARGHSMGQRDLEQAQKQDEAMRAYIRDAAGPRPGGPGHTDDLTRLADLHASGALDDEEFQKAKDKLLT